MKNEITISLISLAIGALFGSGAVFQAMQMELEQKKFEIEKTENR